MIAQGRHDYIKGETDSLLEEFMEDMQNCEWSSPDITPDTGADPYEYHMLKLKVVEIRINTYLKLLELQSKGVVQ